MRLELPSLLPIDRPRHIDRFIDYFGEPRWPGSPRMALDVDMRALLLVAARDDMAARRIA
jgi:hypothetical protein